MSRRMIVTCKSCFSADDVDAVPAPDHAGFIYTCTNRAGHDGGGVFVWQQDPNSAERAWTGADGILDDLYDPLLSVFEPGEPLLEHGIVEARLRLAAPAVFAEHVAEAGHVMFGAIRNTASGRIAMALGRLRAEGHLVDRRAPGTGGWSHNQDIGFWGLPPAALGRPLMTWLQFARDTDRSPEFTDHDRAGLKSLRQGVVQPWEAGQQ